MKIILVLVSLIILPTGFAFASEWRGENTPEIEALLKRDEARRKKEADEHTRKTEAFWNGLKRIKLGMTEAQVIATIGEPHAVRRSVGSWGVHEQWKYWTKVYLYMENGILRSYQE